MYKLELISTGEELLIGKTLNSHAHCLGSALQGLPVMLSRDTTIRDDVAEIRSALHQALKRADCVLLSGGLGATEDDITRDAVATELDCGMHLDATAVEWIREHALQSGREMTDFRARQALVLDGADVLQNPVGAAPGERIDLPTGKTVFMLPGPPREFAALLEAAVLPWLRERCGAAAVAHGRILMVYMAEADILKQFSTINFPPSDIDVAYCASVGGVELRLTSGQVGALDSAVVQLRSLLGRAIVAEQRCTLAQRVVELLVEDRQTVAVAESCTGGLLGAHLTDVPGGSAAFPGGVISYSNASKQRDLAVPETLIAEYGAVSTEVAAAMAHGVRARFESDYALAISGIAGPDGGTEEKPVGTVCIALAGPDVAESQMFRFSGNREEVRERSAQRALNLLRLAIEDAR